MSWPLQIQKNVAEFDPFPFAGIVGHALAKKALLLLAVDPKLGGIIMASGPGTAKTTLARSFHALLPPIAIIKDCPFNCDPLFPEKGCSACRADYSSNEPVLESTLSVAPFINLPLNTTEDRLLGGLSLEAALQEGRKVARRGMLAAANRGVLYCDEINLLDFELVNNLLAVLSRGRVELEREGLSRSYPTSFMLLGTYNPAEGDLREGLSDRVGLLIPFFPSLGTDERAEITRLSLDWARNPSEITARYKSETLKLKRLIAAGRELLPEVEISREQLLVLAEAAVRMGIEGNRVDIFAVRAALASAAFDGRKEVSKTDLEIAVGLVLFPRAKHLPDDRPEQPPPSEPPTRDEQEQADNPEPPKEAEPPKEPEPQQILPEDLILAALKILLPDDVLDIKKKRERINKPGSRGENNNFKRGRHTKSLPRKSKKGRISIIDTFLAAVPHQLLRRENIIRPVKQPLSVNATDTQSSFIGPNACETAAPALIVRPEDFRFKRYKDKAGVLFIFVVDASGSMALNRMREAKGAVTKLLQQAYVHRDKVALISFRELEAQVLLPPTQSVELAKKALDNLPTGGGTPLASALNLSRKLAEAAWRQGTLQTMLVLVTDGRGNVLLEEDKQIANLTREERKKRASQEVQQLAFLIAATNISAVVLDTKLNFLARGESEALARDLQGRYIYLPNANSQSIAAHVNSAAGSLR